VNLNDNTQADRRHSDRFPIEREVRYRVLNKRSSEESGDGKTINISSSGVLFTVEHMLLPGRRMELAISWPAQLNNKCALKLVARGRVVRYEGNRAAIEIQQYEFRTQSSQPPAAATTAGIRLVSN
jgi:c-di-GMP-binding flagellar brake protein YcgR